MRLNQALNSRIVIEQAKGMFAERAQVDMLEAFSAARVRPHTRRRLDEVATDVVHGGLDLTGRGAFSGQRVPAEA